MIDEPDVSFTASDDQPSDHELVDLINLIPDVRPQNGSSVLRGHDDFDHLQELSFVTRNVSRIVGRKQLFNLRKVKESFSLKCP